MNRPLVCVAAMFLAACGTDQPETATAKQDAPQVAQAAQTSPAASEVTNEKIDFPAYPGATEVESSRFGLHTGTGDTYNVSYRTPDSPVQVAAFYQAEGAKVGKLQESVNFSDDLKTVSVLRPDGSTSAIQAAKDKNGLTVIAMFRFFPAKK